MRVLLATEPARPDWPNEDFAAAASGTAVLLDGAGLPRDLANGCVHGVAWYACTLGGLLAARAADRSLSLTDVLSAGIEQVTAMHAGTCDLGNPATPSATVIIVRRDGAALEYLVLADSVLLLDVAGGEPRVISDTRLDDVAAPLRPSPDLRSGTPEHHAARTAYLRNLNAARNQPGGFWSAATDPAAAGHALTGTEPLSSLTAVALLSDGAGRLADNYHLATWPEIAATLAGHGPADVIRQVRAAEATDPHGTRWRRGKIHDDATILYWPQPGE